MGKSLSNYEFVASCGWGFFVVPIVPAMVLMAWKGMDIIVIRDDSGDIEECYEILVSEIKERMAA